MPRWLRLYTFNEINEFYKKESEKYKPKDKETIIDAEGNINKSAYESTQRKPSSKYK